MAKLGIPDTLIAMVCQFYGGMLSLIPDQGEYFESFNATSTDDNMMHKQHSVDWQLLWPGYLYLLRGLFDFWGGGAMGGL